MSNKLSKFFCFMPLVLSGIGMVSYYLSLSSSPSIENVAPGLIIDLVLLALGVISNYAVFVWLTVVTCLNKDFSGGKKVIWIIGLWVLGLFIYPFYWKMYLKKEDEVLE